MPGEDELKFMQRCLDMAVKAEGMTFPNPMVGAVVVHNDIIVGEGYHLKAGLPHAEVIAINSVADKKLLKLSTLYVNLEPCSHFGRTPPCTDFIISHRIPKVVIGTIDTSKKVSGAGIAKLRDAGCDVIIGVIEDECRKLNRRFFTFHEKRRPHITLKWAQSADGFLDLLRPEGQSLEPNWITGKPERVLVHKWRASEQAILVGAGTVRVDNPRLNVREWKGNNPLRIILSSSGSLNKELAENETPGTTVIFTRNAKAYIPNCTMVHLNENEPAANQITEYLFKIGIQSLLIEGGAQILNHFISTGLWDEARIFSGDAHFNEGVKAPFLAGKIFSKRGYYKSSLEMIMNDRS